MNTPKVNVLIPTYNRPAALAVTLTSLTGQLFRDFGIIISDQSDGEMSANREVRAVLNVLRVHGHPVDIYRHLPRNGMAEQRQFLLDHSAAPYSLFLDDDLILEPYVIRNMFEVIRREGIGFVGSAVIGLSYLNDLRPQEQAVELWDGPVVPEEVRPDLPSWQRYRLHNAANLYHVQDQLGCRPEEPVRYKVAWVGGCVMYDSQKLRAAGGFSFWKELPPKHSGEDVLAQLRVMREFGGCGIMPSGVYHQELPTTIPDRQIDAPRVLKIAPEGKMN